MRYSDEELLLARELKQAGFSYRIASLVLGRSIDSIQNAIVDRARRNVKESDRCADCGKLSGVLHAHHVNYEPEEVVLVCPACHRDRHKVMKYKRPDNGQDEIVDSLKLDGT